MYFRFDFKPKTMKTTVSYHLRGVAFLILFLLTWIPSHSQDLVFFKNGTRLKCVITYQSKDTVKYYIKGTPNVIIVDQMKYVDRIVTEEQRKQPHSDTITLESLNVKYLHYKRVTTSGAILIPVGAVVGGIGYGVLSSPHVEMGAAVFGCFAIGLGGGLFLTGIIKSVAGSIKKAEYRRKLENFSIDIHVTPNKQVIGAVIRF